MLGSVARVLARTLMPTQLGRIRNACHADSQALDADYGTRELLPRFVPYFDPFIFLVHSAPPPFTPEYDLIMRGELPAAKKEADAKFLAMRDEARLPYLFTITSGLHELRHFHECFSTTAGFSRVLRVIADGGEFHTMWNELKRSGRVCLPLARWGQTTDAPDVLKSYLSKRRTYVEWLNAFDGSVPAISYAGTSDAHEVELAYAIGGLPLNLVAVPSNLVHKMTGTKYHKIVPLGFQVVTEGTAFLLQRMVVTKLFGSPYAARMKASMRDGSLDDEGWYHYMTVDHYLTKRLGYFYERFQLTLSDLVLMAPDPPDSNENLPGRRLSLSAASAHELGPFYQQPKTDFWPFVDRIADSLGWKDVNSIVNGALEKSTTFLGSLHQEPKPVPFWSALLGAAHQIHAKFLAVRRKCPDCIADPESYLALLNVLPSPPVGGTGGNLEFRAPDDAGVLAFRTWFFFEHTQRQLLFATHLPCPINDGVHRCPGDPLRKRWLSRQRWQATDQCSYSQFLHQFGILDVDFATVGKYSGR